MSLYEWANRWQIPHQAVAELRQMIGVDPCAQSLSVDLTSEAGVSKQIRLDAARSGGMLFRNNVGAMQDDSGRVVRFGLANESKRMNQSVKSSDLIGIQPVMITDAMVGHIIGQFVARECKAPGWAYAGTPREQAQRKFIELIIARGGDGSFENGSR